MGFFSAIGNFFSSVGSAVVSACQSIGGAVASLGPTLAAALTANPIGMIIAAVGLVINLIKSLGIKEVDETDIKDGKLAVMMDDCKDTVKPEITTAMQPM